MHKLITFLTSRLHGCPAKTRQAGQHCGVHGREGAPAGRIVLVTAQRSQDPNRQEKAMFTNPYLSGELARQRQRDMQAQADRRRLARRLHATSGTAPSRQRLRGALRAAARLRPAPGT
jgi:hypothetical protein